MFHFKNDGNRVLKMWYSRYSANDGKEKGMFHFIEERLKEKCPHLGPSPFRAILSDPEHVLPVYYALCNLMEDNPKTIAREVCRLATLPETEKLKCAIRSIIIESSAHVQFVGISRFQDQRFFSKHRARLGCFVGNEQ